LQSWTRAHQRTVYDLESAHQRGLDWKRGQEANNEHEEHELMLKKRFEEEALLMMKEEKRKKVYRPAQQKGFPGGRA
jgi:hypothetical protein